MFQKTYFVGDITKKNNNSLRKSIYEEVKRPYSHKI